MKLSSLTLNRLHKRIIGDEGGKFPRLTGADIIELFNQIGFNDIYNREAGGLPEGLSRKDYTHKRLKEINGERKLQQLMEMLVSKSHFLDRSGFNRLNAVEQLNTVLGEDNYALVDTGDSLFKVQGGIQSEEVVIEAHFQQNRKVIIEEVRKAKFLVWVATAWLTDNGLLTELRLKKEQGLNIQIVTQDDDINAGLKVPVEQTFDAYYKAPTGPYKNLMHHKFCIIDLYTVVHGSYNWTVKAQYNEETVTINHSRELASQFAETFMEMKRG